MKEKIIKEAAINSADKYDREIGAGASSRRSALRKLSLGAVSGAVAVSTPDQWLKPLVETVVLPAHATATPPVTILLLGCYSVSITLFGFDNTPPSGGNANFKIELTSDAPDAINQVAVTASVDNGTLVGVTSGDLYIGNSLVFAWTGAGVSGIAVPNAPTELSVDWVCASGKSGTSVFDLVDLALTASGA